MEFILKHGRLFGLLGAATLLALFVPFLRWFERANLYLPSRTPSGVLPRSFGLASEDAELRSADGVRLSALFLPAAPYRPEPRAAPVSGPLAPEGLVLLYSHGNAGNITHRFMKANIFHRLGLGVLLYDYRGYGQSEGRPTEQGTYADAEAAWSYLTGTRKVPPERIVIYGESLGCAVAVELARRHRARAVILESPFTSVPDMADIVFPHLPLGWAVSYRYDNSAKIREIRAPLLVLHSRDDEIVPFAMGRRLFDAAAEPKEFFEMRGDHNEGYLDTGPAYSRALLSFLERPETGPRKK
jgi:fermentation-respiration switch protein FrsA (DUF1100 family)